MEQIEMGLKRWVCNSFMVASRWGWDKKDCFKSHTIVHGMILNVEDTCVII